MDRQSLGLLFCSCVGATALLVGVGIERRNGSIALAAENKVGVQVSASGPNNPIPLIGTEPLILPSDLLHRQREEIIDYFLRQIAATPAKRDQQWKPDFSSAKAYQASVRSHWESLGRMLGLEESEPGKPQVRVLERTRELQVEDVTIPLHPGYQARALLFLPQRAGAKGAVIAIPSAQESREDFAGIAAGTSPPKWLTGLLARNVVVAIPLMVERRADHPLCQKTGGQDRRRMLWRLGFIVGRTLVALDVEQAIAVRNFLAVQTPIDPARIAVLGKDQGGMTALYAAAVDERLAGATVVDYFQQRERCWNEPVDRTLCGQLNEFGDAEVAALIAPRPLTIVHTSGDPAALAGLQAEAARARRFYQGLRKSPHFAVLAASGDGMEAAASLAAEMLGAGKGSGKLPTLAARVSREEIDASQNDQFVMLYQYLRNLCEASDQVRKQHWDLMSTSQSERPRKAAQLQDELARLVGAIPIPKEPLHAQTALIGATEKFLAYDVLLDVLPGVHAYGQLLIPRAIPGQTDGRLPAVICQHGFGGAPKDVTGLGNDPQDAFYHRFGKRLAQRGYVVFAPYLTVPVDDHPPTQVHRADLLNPIVRQAVTIGKMRTSLELAKLRRIVDFLQSLPFVAADRVGYYGLSYGGYSATWMPPLEPRLKLTIISAFFNDWRLMLTDETRIGQGYWSLPDEDFYNWNVLNRFTHREMIAAMWPRPVCIEYGLEDQVTTPEWHGRAWAEVAKFTEAWGLGSNIVDTDFSGPHAIHGIGTFFFLDRWLRPESPAGRDYGCCDQQYCYEDIVPASEKSSGAKEAVPYVTHRLDHDPESLVEGQFYVPRGTEMMTGLALKVARVGHPGDLVIELGTEPGKDDVGRASLRASDMLEQYDLWSEARLEKPVRLDANGLYFFRITTQSGRAPDNYYVLFGPRPLGGQDFPRQFGLAFRVLSIAGESPPRSGH